MTTVNGRTGGAWRSWAWCAGAGAAIITASVMPAGCAKKLRRTETMLPTPVPPVFTTSTTESMERQVRLEWAIGTAGAFVVGVDARLLDELRETRVRLSDGRVLEVRPHVLRVMNAAADGAPEPTSIAARMGWWLSSNNAAMMQRWEAEPVVARGNIGAGAPVLVVEVTNDGSSPVSGGEETTATGELDGRPVTVRWLPSVAGPGAGEALAKVFGRAMDEEALESAWMRAALLLAERSPLTRWRARLARGELAATSEEGGQSAPARFDDPVVEALATTVEAQWVAGLSRLAVEDAVMARRVVEQLCMVLDFGGGVIVPGWTPDGEQWSPLLNAMLEPGTRAAGAARAWLEATPATLCWVIDDGGAADAATGKPEGMIGVANLTAAPLAAWVEPPGENGAAMTAPPQIVAVSPRSVRHVLTGLRADPEVGAMPVRLAADAALRGVRATLRVGDLVYTPTVYSARVPALAPGVVIGTMHPDWNLDEWLAASANVEYSKRRGPWGDADRSSEKTTGLVYRGVDVPLERGTSIPDRWLLFLEVAGENQDRGMGGTVAAGANEEFVRVWLGPTGRSRIVLKVMRDGRVVDESPGTPGAPVRDVPRLARVVETTRGWSFWLTIPQGAIEQDGLLRLGLERVDRGGVRTSWPRPSLPWQHEPARLGIGTEAWSER